jgi:DNA repair exonuclease SbcCD ATPase subunit
VDINYIKIKDSIANGAETIAKKSQEFIEISSLKLRISSYESKIKELYNELGEKYYKLYRHGKDENNNLKKICKRIDELNTDINVINKKIKDID